MRDYIVYDIEIAKGILGRGEVAEDDISYCKGWSDHQGMGISSVVAYDSRSDRYRIFMEDNFDQMKALFAETDTIKVGFNNIGFDQKVLEKHGFEIGGHQYDLLREIWMAAGLSPEFNFRTHGGYGLDKVMSVNFPKEGKSGHGANAPKDFQRKRYGSLIDYNLDDVRLTLKLLHRVLECGWLINPKKGNQVLRLNIDLFFTQPNLFS